MTQVRVHRERAKEAARGPVPPDVTGPAVEELKVHSKDFLENQKPLQVFLQDLTDIF